MYLIKNNMSEYIIAISNNATVTEKTAANELKEYLYKMAKVDLPVTAESDAGEKTLYVGHTLYAKAHGIMCGAEEAWKVKAIDNNLIFIGGAEPKHRGSLYAVYHFFEDSMGVRWWTPWEEHVPKLRDFQLPDNFEISGQPLTDARLVLFTYDIDFRYFARNRMNDISACLHEGGAFNEYVKTYGGALYPAPPHHVHTLNLYFPPDKYFDEHPDWYAWSEKVGSRIPFGQLCITNEDFFRAMLGKLIENIEACNKMAEQEGLPKPWFYSISYADTHHSCECEKCLRSVANSGHSGHLLKFVNRLARKIAEVYPDVLLEMPAYSFQIEPPLDNTLPEKNVMIRFADIRDDLLHDIQHRFNNAQLQRLKKWSDIVKKSGCKLRARGYMCYQYIHSPFPNIFKYAKDIKTYYDYNVVGYFYEHTGCLTVDFWEMRQWVSMRLVENPLSNFDTILDDFIFNYYGEAGQHIKDYILMAHDVSDKTEQRVVLYLPVIAVNFVSLNMVLDGNNLFEKAIETVRGNQVLTRRVRAARSCLDKTIVLRYRDFVRSAAKAGIAFPISRREAAKRVVESLKERLALTGYDKNGNLKMKDVDFVEAQFEIDFFNQFTKEEYVDTVSELPKGLTHISPERIYDVRIMDIYRFRDFERFGNSGYGFMTEGRGYGEVEDSDVSGGVVAKLNFDKMNQMQKLRYQTTSKNARKPMPFRIFVKGNAVSDYSDMQKMAEFYNEQLHPDTYALYKIEGLEIDGKSNSVLFLVNYFEICLDLSMVSLLLPAKKYDVYLRMKVTGSQFGGREGDENAIYFDRIYVAGEDTI